MQLINEMNRKDSVSVSNLNVIGLAGMVIPAMPNVYGQDAYGEASTTREICRLFCQTDHFITSSF